MNIIDFKQEPKFRMFYVQKKSLFLRIKRIYIYSQENWFYSEQRKCYIRNQIACTRVLFIELSKPLDSKSFPTCFMAAFFLTGHNSLVYCSHTR